MSLLNWLLTILSCLLALLIVLYTVRERRTLGRRVDILLDAIARLGAAVEEHAEGAGLRGALGRVGEVAESGPLAVVWRDYRASLVDLGEDAPPGAPAPASRFFNAELPYRAGLDLRRFDALPNLLVGAGLFLTFVGLALSIFVAQLGMSGDTHATIEALHNLLAAAAFKFVTSIGAIGAALWFGRSRNDLYSRLDAALETLCVVLDARTAPVSDVAATAAVRDALEHQTMLLDRDQGRFGVEIEAAMNRALAAHLGAAMKPVAVAIESMGVHLGAQNVAALRQMVETFSERLGGSARTHTDHLAAILDEAGRAMRGAPAAIGKASEAFADLIDQEARAFATRVNGATEHHNRALEQTRQVLQRLTQEAADLHAGIAKTERLLLDRVGAVDAEFARAGASLHEGARALQAAVAAIGPIDVAGDRLAAAAAALAASAGAAARLTDQADRFAGKMVELDGAIAGAVDRLAGQLDSNNSLPPEPELVEADPAVPRPDSAPTPAAPSALAKDSGPWAAGPVELTPLALPDRPRGEPPAQ